MKKTNWLIIIGIFVVLVATAVIAPYWYGTGNASTEANLVGRWSFEGNFVDSSGKGNHGTQSGGVKIATGVKGRGIVLDGSNDYVTIPNSGSINITGNRSISAWIKTTYTAGATKIVSKEDSSRRQYTLDVAAGGTAWFSVRDGAGNKFEVNTDSVISDGAWHHVVGVLAGTNGSVYVDGVFSNSSSNPAIVLTNTAVDDSAYIGMRFTGSSNFNGSIDEVRIYNVSLTAAEVYALYDSNKSAYLNIKDDPTLGITDETGLVAYYKMDAGTGSSSSTVVDSSGKGNTGTVSGAKFINEGRFKEAYKFDGEDDYIDAGNGASLNFSLPNFTVSLWLKSSSATQQGIISKYGGEVPLRAWRIDRVVTSGYVTIFAYNSTGTLFTYQDICNGNVFYPDVWMHLSVVFNITNINCYMDGSLKESTALTMTDIQQVPYSLEIGRVNTGAQPEFNGTIDEVRIYNRSLSSTEIGYLYGGSKSNYLEIKDDPSLGLTDETGLVGKWSMNTNDGSNSSIAQDTSGLNNDGIVTGATFTNEGRFKEGYKLEGSGSGDYISTTLAPIPSNVTVCGWLKQIDATPLWCFFDSMNLAGNTVGVAMYSAAGDEKVYFLVGNGTAGGSTSLSTTYTTYENKWTHICGSYGGGVNANDMKIYFNGVLITTGNVTNPTASLSTYGLTLGARLAGTSNYIVNGSIDEIRVYNRSLSETEVGYLYNGQKSNYFELQDVIG